MEITFGTYVAPVAANPFTDTIKAMLDMPADTSVTVVVPSSDAGKTRLAIGKAANEAGKTAKMIENAVGAKPVKGVPHVQFTFILVGKHKARRGNK